MQLKDFEIVSKTDLEETYKRPDCVYTKKCLEYTEGEGIVPLYVNNDKFTYINALANFVFYSGFLSNRPNAHISATESKIRKIEKNITGKLGLKTKIIPASDGFYGSILTFKECGAYIQRILRIMGVPEPGRKSSIKKLEIPWYRKALVGLANSGELDEGEKGIAKKLERDSTAVLLSERTSPDRNNPKTRWVLYFFARPSEEEARGFAEENLEMVKFAVPEIEIGKEDIRTRRNESGSISTYIPINGKNTECILDAHGDLLKFSPKLQKLYGFKLDFEPVGIF